MQDIKTPHIPVREDWLNTHTEAILEPEISIVDAHHHLWDRPGARYLFPQFQEDMWGGHDVRQTVYVQCRSMYRSSGPVEMRPVGEVEFANGIAALGESGIYGALRPCAAIVGGADLLIGDKLEPVLETMRAISGGRLKGIRNPVAWHENDAVRSSPVLPPPSLMRDRRFLNGAACLQRLGLSLDVWAYHSQLRELVDLAKLLPDLHIVLDHLGGPIGVGLYTGKRDAVFDDWKGQMTLLAQLPNVYVKLGGLGMPVMGFTFHEQPRAPSSSDLAIAWRPYIHTCIELFGVGRCMFESNFPVDKGMFSYAVLWNAFKRLASGASAQEKAALFSATAKYVYRLPVE